MAANMSVLTKIHHVRTDSTVAEMIHPDSGFKIASYSEPKWGALNWYHSDYELIYVKKGVISVGIGDYLYEASEGSYFFVDSNQPHYIDVKDGTDFLWNAILFDPSALGGKTDN
ncbi:MAG: cupin domain-containing protein, partial [Clostridia bacterium]